MDLRATYHAIMELQSDLTRQLLEEAADERRYKPHLRSVSDSRAIHALSATLTLQDYLASRIAELDPDQED